MERNVKQMKKSGENGKHMGKNWKTLEKKTEKIGEITTKSVSLAKTRTFSKSCACKNGDVT